MPDSRNEISHQQCPSAAPLKPCVNTREPRRSQVENPAVLHKDVSVEDSAERVADRDAAGAAEKRCQKSGDEGEGVFEDEIAGESEKPFIGYRQSGNPENEQGENSRVSVLRDPLKSCISHTPQY